MRTLYNLNQIYFVDDDYKDQRWILLFIWFIFKIKTLAEFLKMSMEVLQIKRIQLISIITDVGAWQMKKAMLMKMKGSPEI